MSDEPLTPLRITEMALASGPWRDAAPPKLEDLTPVLEALDEAGFWSVEVWGPGTFEQCLSVLREDPWERLRALRARVKKTPLQIALRGRSLVGHRRCSDDLIERFVARARENGVDVFRIFDPLNDASNLEAAIKAVRHAGGHAQGAVGFAGGQPQLTEHVARAADRVLELGVDSLCFMDSAGLLTPAGAFAVVSRLKKLAGKPVSFSALGPAGPTLMACLKAVEAGANVVDCALAWPAVGGPFPPTESLVAAVAGTSRDTGLDLARLAPVAAHFAGILRGQHPPVPDPVVELEALRLGLPAGLAHTLAARLRGDGQPDRLGEVLSEVARVRVEAGSPPLAAPLDRIVGAQALLNVLIGERYKLVTREFGDLVRGAHGRTPMQVDASIVEALPEEEPPTTVQVGSELERAKLELGDLARGEEDLLSYALFPEATRTRLAGWEEPRAGLTPEQLAAIAAAMLPEE